MISPANRISHAAMVAAVSTFALSAASAQSRVLVPDGTVVIVRTQSPLQSATARAGQMFETVVEDTVAVDNYTVIPAGSRIRGVVQTAHAANRQQSGLIELHFDRLTLPDGSTYVIDAALTSTDPAERRQIDSSANQRVVLVGGRGGIGAAIAGAGSRNNPTSSLLGALGAIFSEGLDVNVPAGTPLAVKLERAVYLPRRTVVRTPDESTIYTSLDMIRAAQRALAAQNYYRGPIDGQLSYLTHRALFEYQSDKNLNATGNLDWRTAQLLGLPVPGTGAGAMLSASEAVILRRDAQALVGRQRQELSISSFGRPANNRTYAQGDIDLWFALSAFADNASLYEQIVQSGANSTAAELAGRALVDAARRVDTAMQQARTSATVRNSWASIRTKLSGIDSEYIR